MANNPTNLQNEQLLNQAQNELAMLEIHQANEERVAMMPKKIGPEQLREAVDILNRYKEGKAHLEQKIIANEQFWKKRNWDYHDVDDAEFHPSSAWLFSCIQSRHSDAMDSYPTCNFLPRQADDKEEARRLSAIVPVIFEQNRFEETYSDVTRYFLKQGGCPVWVYWDGTKNNGLGDVAIERLDYLNMFWEPGVVDIQDSENVFVVELVSKKILEQRYPQTQGHLDNEGVTVAKYIYDDAIRTDDKALVINWYYKTEYNGRKAVHFVKFVDDVVLYATENNTERKTRTVLDEQTNMPVIIPIEEEPESVRGLYDHAMYPFVCHSLYPIEGSLCGYGLTDIGRDAQMQIDVMDKAITENTVQGAAPRYFTKGDGTINEDEFRNTNKPFIHVQGSLNDENIRPVDYKPLPSIYLNVLESKVNELKYATSNQDVNNGVAPSGITAASALAALQETSGKNVRESNKSFYRMYRDIVYMVVELIRQFYNVPRTFRIAPDVLGEEFVQYSNAGLVPQKQTLNGEDMGFRKPEFDIEVTAEKASPYKKMEQNELAINFYQLGFFNPQMAEQAKACITMMDFPRKEDVIGIIDQNSMILQNMLRYQQMALMLAQKYEPELAKEMAQNILGAAQQPIPNENTDLVELDANKESSITGKAREQARETTEVQ